MLLAYFYGAHPESRHARLAYFYFYWGTAILLSLLRILAITEICKHILKQSPTVWTLTWRVVAFIGFCLVLWTAFGVIHDRLVVQQYINTLEQRLNVLAAFVSLAVMGIGIYYRLHFAPLFRGVLIGSCIYSAVQLVDSEVGRYTNIPSNSVYDFMQRFSFDLMMVIWAWALWKWSGAPPQSQQLIPQAQYDDLSPQVHNQLRELNDRLSSLRKKD
jgi:hypothetical protein